MRGIIRNANQILIVFWIATLFIPNEDIDNDGLRAQVFAQFSFN